jgi:hypothetical protein
MPHLGQEPHLRRVVRVVIREGQCRFKEATLEISMIVHLGFLPHRECQRDLQRQHST